MSWTTRAAIGLILTFGTGSAAYAQSSASASATGSTTILQPITLTKTADLAFGRIVKPSSGVGAVAITNASDSVAATSGAVSLAGIATSRAKFTINGEGGQSVSVSVPASFTMTHSNGTDALSVTLSGDLGASTVLSGSLGSSGSKNLNVGGSFNLAAAAATGVYTGTFQVTVAYE